MHQVVLFFFGLKQILLKSSNYLKSHIRIFKKGLINKTKWFTKNQIVYQLFKNKIIS